MHGVAFVCTGMKFWGRERAGDVLATLWGLSQRPEFDLSRLALAGWSHGAWTIMDLMTMPLEQPGEAAVADPDPRLLDGLRSTFLAYPYGGYGALSRRRQWRRHPVVLGVIPSRDHVTRPTTSRRLYKAAEGCDIEIWEVEGATHSFDEPTGVPPMRYDTELLAQSVERFRLLLERTVGSSR